MPFANLSGLVLHYRTEGKGDLPNLVLLNSLGTDYRIWDGLVGEVENRYRILRYDERGQGLSASPAGRYSIRDHAKDLLALLECLGWGPSILCGLSIGGMIAMETCLRRPDLVRGLVLADTADAIGPRSFWDERIEQIREHGIAPIAESVMARWFGSSFRQARMVDVEGWTYLLARSPVTGYLGSCAALRDADLGSSIVRIEAPAVCICGSEDLATPPPVVRRLASRLPNAEFVEIEGVGHLAPVERPGEFAAILDRFAGGRLGP